MKKILTICSISFLLTACATSPEVQYCKDTTPRLSRERWDCLNSIKREQQSNQVTSPQQPMTAYEEAVIKQMQLQNIQNSINQITAPKIITPPAPYVNQNQNPFYYPPQSQPIQPPSVNCVPNGVGGFRCQ